MKEDIAKLVNFIRLAHSRSAYTLEESAIIYKVILSLNSCPIMEEKRIKVNEKDLEIIYENKELK